MEMMTYGYTIRWSGGAVTANGHARFENAVFVAVDIALASGWTPPRWWEFWRWSETQVDDHIRAALDAAKEGK